MHSPASSTPQPRTPFHCVHEYLSNLNLESTCIHYWKNTFTDVGMQMNKEIIAGGKGKQLWGFDPWTSNLTTLQ